MARRTVLLLVLASLLGPAVARADRPIATVARDTPLVAQGSTVAWLTQPTDGGAGRVIAYKAGDRPVVTTAVRARDDLGAGRDARGRLTFTWSDCRRGARRCPVYGLRPGQRTPRVLARVRRSGTDLVPALAGHRLITARRVGRGGFGPCDAPVVRRLGRPGRTRVLRPGVCGELERLAVHRGRVLARFFNVPGAGTLSMQLQSIPLAGGAARRIVHTSGTMTPNDIGGFGPRRGGVDFALPGSEERTPSFARFSRRTGRLQRARAFDRLTGAFAPLRRGAAFLVPRIAVHGAPEVPCTAAVPCTVVVSRDVFRPRTLVRRVLLDGGGRTRTITGRLERREVGPERLRRTTGVAGVPVELLSTAGADFDDAQYPDRATPTGLRGVTGRDGRFAIALPAPAYRVEYIARTADGGVPATGYTPVG